MAGSMKPKLKVLKKRRSSLFASIKREFSFTSSDDQTPEFPFSQESSVKPWTSMDNLDKAENGQKPTQRQSNIVNLNIGGKIFHIPKHLVLKYPKSRIGLLAMCEDPVKRLSLCDDYNVQNNEFFFDRDPMFFHYIFHFYCSNVLWVMDSLCPVNFEEEMSFWGLRLKDTPRCCRILFEEKLDDIREKLKVNDELIAEIKPHQDDAVYQTMFLGDFRKMLWDLMENPYSSLAAKAFAVFSSLFVLISIVAMTMNTVKELREYKLGGKTYMEWIEIASILFFTVEYFLRLVTTANIEQFVKSALNFVDLVAVMPYFLQIIFETFFIDSEDMSAQEDLKTMARVSKVSKVLKVVKLMRIFRILKLARHSTGMRAFGFTIRQCSEQVCCLFLFIAMGIFTFSALMHSVETDQPGTPFSSIPETWWWAAVSISTVGYGDVVPVSYLGRCVAFGCISFGIILNGMPISILFNKFSDYYAKLKEQEYTYSNTERTFQLRKRMRRRFQSCLEPPDLDDSDDETHYRPTVKHTLQTKDCAGT
ncbi:potassium voltage-gated channel subfamily V member 2 [Periophthalmus magnuspinnatus]|uniref:potassium voltage-gated channel subfamily V member 2 n=1 Tax=Periophthalmus magnuspinnatus TaxID=409849 RepID=UPI00145B8FD1|nr:potassium voltage-gated channel subfamily V member 2 [Periophthalmus magnuspinnatus]